MVDVPTGEVIIGVRIGEGKAVFENFFKLKENNTNVRQEVLAGVTTFLTMAYIIFVNPSIVSATGMPQEAVMIATCMSAALATILMGLLANYPFALAPGMGLNAYFTYTVVLQMGVSWQTALGAVFISGVIFLILTLVRIREAIIDAVPTSLKHAIGAGIGLFIAFIGLQNGGLIVDDPATFVALGDVTKPQALVALLGLALIAILLVLRVKGAILIGIAAATIIAVPAGITTMPDKLVAFPSFAQWAPVFGKLNILAALNLGLTTVVFAFLFVDMFDTVGTLIGVSGQAGFLKNGKLPRAHKALLSDSLGTIAGSVFGTPTVTTYIESAAGVAAGGRTGLTAVVVALGFLLALFFTPLAGIIPGAATAPALIIVGAFMMAGITNIDWKDYQEAIPAFLTVIIMPLSFSISNGIFAGFIAYAIISLFTGRGRDVHWLVYLLAALFILKFTLIGG